ncbi:MAG TPA: HepT-like ribonuclease domain-containing protein, partial [Rhodothermales bacterium]|nr:HepT-like ribonuclease domain-containing protein [Rhodothermales bacterium]
IKQAADLLGEFTDGKQFTDYEKNSMLRAAVERKFEIIGEALSKLSKTDSAIASRIGEYARIIAFRSAHPELA